MVRSVLLATAGALLLGCSKGPHDIVPVSGRVTVNGKPYANLAVSFQPAVSDKGNHPPPGSGGMTDNDGRYTLKVVGTDLAGRTGAVVGKHYVSITYFIERDPFDDGPPKVKPAVEIPARYTSGKLLTFDVPSGGTNKADFDLK